MKVFIQGVALTLSVLPVAVLAQYEAIHIDELGLSEEEKNRRNIISGSTIIALNSTNIAGTVLGFVPEPITSYSAEIASLAADNSLKFTKPLLYAPDDVVRFPNRNGCSYDFDLPKSIVEWDNPLGLWPKLGDDALFSPRDADISFGDLGIPTLLHANTDVNLNIYIPSSPSFEPESEVSQNISLSAGAHNIEWQADTLWFPIWDLVVPTALTSVMIASEFKWASEIRRLKKLKGDALEISSIKNNTKALQKQLDNLDRKIGLFEKLEKVEDQVLDKTGSILGANITSERIIERFFSGVNTVSRTRIQTFTVYDIFPPSISTSESSLLYEATDIGGVKASRYLNDMRGYISASDECSRSVTVSNDAPEFFPMGDTIVTWTVRDLGPARPNIDHDDDGIIDGDTYFTRTVTQSITVEDTQAPILVPPPALVIESNTVIDLNDQALGQPLVVDLADLHPDVSSSSNSADGLIAPDNRTRVTWTATDASANSSASTQLVTVKTPGTNTTPVVMPQSLETLTSKPIDIVLTGTDADVLPFSNTPGEPGVADPLQFRIEQLPQNGEFVAPLYPYFVNDYRTDTTGVLTDDEAFAQANNQLVWLNGEYCSNNTEVPLNFIFNPLFVHVIDDGEQYFLDHYAVCDPNGTGSPEIESRIRISRWDKDRNFIGHVDYNPSEGTHNSSFALDPDGNIYYLLSFGVNEYSLQSCDSNISGTNGDCSQSFNFTSNDGGIGISASKYARVDSSATAEGTDPLIYLTDGERVNIYQGQVYLGQLVNDSGQVDFLEDSGSACEPISGGGGNQGYGMELDSVGNFYIADTCGDRIHKFTPSSIDSENDLIPGEYVGWMGQCSGSTNLACDEDLQHSKGFSCTDVTCTVSGDGSGSDIGQFLDPVYLAVDPNDVLYVADYGNQRIQRFGSDGTFAGQAKSTGNGINADTEGAFILGNMGPPRHVSVNSEQFFVVDQGEKFVHVFDASPFKDISDYSATVSYVSQFDFHSDDDTFAYSVNDGLVDSNTATVTIGVARNYRQPLPVTQVVNVPEDQSAVIILSGSDPDGIVDRDFNGLDRLTFLIAEQPKHGTLVLGGNSGAIALDPGMEVWTYTPDRDYHGADSFSFTVSDEFTDATMDGPIVIPEPYGEAEPTDVLISVQSVNDVPIIDVAQPQKIAAGFPVMLQATAYDDPGSDYIATLSWGDGKIDQNGKIIVDDSGTPKNYEDDVATITGVIFNEESLSSIGQSPVNGMHTYTAIGSRNIQLCFRDGDSLEACQQIAVEVEQLVAMNAETILSTDEVTDGIPFNATINVKNAEPIAGVAGIDASNVTLRLDVPAELILLDVTTDQGTCNVVSDGLNCSFGDLVNGTVATVELTLRGKGQLIYDEIIYLDAEVSTDTPALEETILGSASLLLKTIVLDRDGDGLPNVFEAFYGVSDANADDDGDGLNNLAELEAGTSPIESDSDGDGISDGDESNLYGTDPLEADTDGDGLSDNQELVIDGTDPLTADSDDDGLPDKWEIDNGFDPQLSDSTGDTDGDGLSDGEEYSWGTDYLLDDTDNDNLLDGEEVNHYRTDPLLIDTDTDGLNDDAELASGTDQLKPDSDDDGLLDGEEVNNFGTLPLVADTDRDSLPDGWEIRNNRNPIIADYKLAAGGLSSCALTDAGVECWGRNNFEQAPALVSGLNNPVDITMGFVHACAIDVAVGGNRSVQCWGDDTYGQSSPPLLLEPLEVTAGSYHTCVLDRVAENSTEVKCWGRDNQLQVSDTPNNLSQPIQLVSSISGSSSCVLDLTVNGPELVCWGEYNNANSQVPSNLTNTTSALALGSEHGCIVDGGNQQCWGLNDDAQAPVGAELSASAQLSLGGFHSCSLVDVGLGNYAVDCWGRNVDGQTDVPVALVAPINLASGSHHNCVLDQGSAKCWGRNTSQEAPALKQLEIDPDGDGVPTAIEIASGTNPLDSDTDRDQLTDASELSDGTDPTTADTDEDGIDDGDEINVYLSDPLNNDSDADNIPDGWEVEYGLLPTINDGTDDNDGDGLNNYAEYLNGTDPTVVDSDGDGLSDGAEATYLAIENTGQQLGSQISQAVKLGDLDDDGDVDAVVVNSAGGNNVWVNDGTGTFTIDPQSPLNELLGEDVALADTDGDGDLDIAFSHSVLADANSLWVNDGAGVFSSSEFDLGSFNSGELAFGVFEPGSDADLYISGADDSKFVTFSGGDYHSPNLISYSTEEHLVLGDLNGDGLDDFVMASPEDETVTVYRMIGPFLDLRMVQYAPIDVGGAVESVALGDLDDDGLLDLYMAISDGPDQIWINDATDSFHFINSGQAIGSETGFDVELADIDSDGDLDAVIANDGNNKIWLNDGAGVMTDSGLDFEPGRSLGFHIGDLDGDKDLDVFVANDGANSIWMLKTLSATDADSDGDGALDGWEIDNGLNPLDDADADFDSDLDGLSNAEENNAGTDPFNSDSDGDGIPDGWELRNGLDPLSNDSALDLDIDGLSNLEEYQQGGVPEADDVPPVVTAPNNVQTDSTGLLTDVAIGTATAIDAKDGSVSAVVTDAGPYPSGSTSVIWSAIDNLGNVGVDDQSINVTPQVSFSVDQVVDEGAVAVIAVELNGPAVNYPVQVNYSVSGVATFPEDHDAVAGSIVIESGTRAEILINIVEDTIYEPAETFQLSMSSVVNAVSGPKTNHNLTISEKNGKPTALIVVTQQNQPVTTIVADGGPLTIAATINDPNVGDSHSADWSGSDSGLFDNADFNDLNYSIDPSTLTEGLYKIVVDVADDGLPIETNRVESLIRVVASAPVLGSDNDSDGDGLSDFDEGFSDSDSDRVPDYLDANNSVNSLLLSDDGYWLEAQPGLRLRLGSEAYTTGSDSELVELEIEEDIEYEYPSALADFEILGVEPGESAMVVVPLQNAIPENSLYRKYSNGVWQDFLVDNKNSVFSAPGSNGACPAPGDNLYVLGLKIGDSCLQLLIEDGGPNDADGIANGTIIDPGGLAVLVGVSLEVLPVSDLTIVDGSNNNVVFALRFVSDSGGAELDSLSLEVSGSGDIQEIQNIRVFIDANSNGVVDEGEEEIASGEFDQNGGGLELNMISPYAIPVGQTDMLVTYDF